LLSSYSVSRAACLPTQPRSKELFSGRRGPLFWSHGCGRPRRQQNTERSPPSLASSPPFAATCLT
jgi:hypothetical protein